MPKISFDITDEEVAAILSVTREAAQTFLERNARSHIEGCVRDERTRRFNAIGIEAQVASTLPEDELQAIADMRAAKKAAAEAAAAATALNP